MPIEQTNSPAPELLVGTAEVDITPEVGIALAGGVRPRASTAVGDPLKIKALALENGGKTLVYVILDVLGLTREVADRAVALAVRQSGVNAESMLWAASHTHCGPYTVPLFGIDAVDRDWLEGIPDAFARCVSQAVETKSPCRMRYARAYQWGLSLNRRIRFKDGWERNRWLVGGAEAGIQALGAAGPVDPEIGVLAFVARDGGLLACMFQSVLHANTRSGNAISADYPAVVASRLAERYGSGAAVLYVPGACGDINRNPSLGHREVGDAVAELILEALADCPAGLEGREYETDLTLCSAKRNVVVPLVDPEIDYEERLAKSQWPQDKLAVFREALERVRREGRDQAETVVQAWRIGRIGLASLPGESLVDIGLRIKEQSPFPWTFPVELGGDYLGYLLTPRAWAAGGYEALIGSLHQPTPEGVETLTETALAMLRRLYHGQPNNTQ